MTRDPTILAASTGNPMEAALHIRTAHQADGASVWALVKSTHVLDLNSSYAYVLVCDLFGDSCVVAEERGALLGFVTGFPKPGDPDTVFLWQVGVSPEAQGRGLGGKLLDAFVRTNTARRATALETTISPGNQASKALFHSFARRHGAAVKVLEGYPASLFPNAHEPEELYRIGPIERS